MLIAFTKVLVAVSRPAYGSVLGKNYTSNYCHMFMTDRRAELDGCK